MHEIRLDTRGKLHEHGYTMACFCAQCRRWGDIDMGRIVAQGRGDALLVRFRPGCRLCGHPGDKQLRTQVRAAGDAAMGWVSTSAW